MADATCLFLVRKERKDVSQAELQLVSEGGGDDAGQGGGHQSSVDSI